MDKLLVILGPTATGKTNIAISLAQKFNGEIVSADSRQVYKGMDVGTGKDLDVQTKEGFRKKEGIRVHLVDIVSPDYQFNVGEYSRQAREAIQDIHTRGKLPIVVGGTGLYIRSILESLDTLSIPPDESLRAELGSLAKDDLQKRLEVLDKKKWKSLNNSDKNNPRRLIRAIEIAQSVPVSGGKKSENKYDSLLIGLMMQIEFLEEKIKQRVDTRLATGLIDELDSLLGQGFNFDLPSFSSCGYGVWRNYFNNKSDQNYKKGYEAWILEEVQYARRQMTFFKKIKGINWFDVLSKTFKLELGDKVAGWYNNVNVTLQG